MESETNNFLNWVEIKNFKSIKDLRMDCKRVNVFIGKPNVGKSNILEGLGLLGGSLDNTKYLNGAIRYIDVIELFYDNNSSKFLEINTNKIDTKIKSNSVATTDDSFVLEWSNRNSYNRHISIGNKGEWLGTFEGLYTDRDNEYQRSPVKKYDFYPLSIFNNSFNDYLLPPYGWNLFEIVKRNISLYEEFSNIFKSQNLEFILNDSRRSFSLQKKDKFSIHQFDFFSIADTFRRFMFYITAIESNKNSVIIFEEPEVHSFPPYTQDVAYRMIYSETNQFFVSTHSPYLLHTLVENLKDDQLNVFVTYYENYETKVKALTPEELSFVQEYSTDIFFNLDRFIPNAESASIS